MPALQGARVGKEWMELNGQKAPIVSTSATQVTIASFYNDRAIIHDVRGELAGMQETSGEYFAATNEDATCLLGGAPHEQTSVERRGWENDNGVAKLLHRFPGLAVRRLNSQQFRSMQDCALGLAAKRHAEALQKQHRF